MEYCVYILQSDVDGTFYKGYTTDLTKRLDEHNAGLSQYTSKKIPWKLVYFERLESKTLSSLLVLSCLTFLSAQGTHVLNEERVKHNNSD